jgi:hypothetical protein
MTEIEPQEKLSARARRLTSVLQTVATIHETEFCATPTPTGGLIALINPGAQAIDA